MNTGDKDPGEHLIERYLGLDGKRSNVLRHGIWDVSRDDGKRR